MICFRSISRGFSALHQPSRSLARISSQLTFNSPKLGQLKHTVSPVQFSKRNFVATADTPQAPRVTFPAPSFAGQAVMPDGSFKEISLRDYSGRYLVLFFYPLDFTFVCPTELTAFADRIKEFEKLENCAVVGASCDSHFTHLAWINTPRQSGGLGGSLGYPLLADFTKSIARSYGVLLDSAGLPLRGLFIIDGKGTLRHSSVNDLPVGRNVEEVLRLVSAFQFTDKHGEVCPADWRPDGDSIKPSPTGSLEYFKKL